MNFKPFDTTNIDAYAEEAKSKWGQTGAYQEFRQKTAGQNKEQQKQDGDALMAVFAEFATVSHLSPEAPEVQAMVAKVQSFITDHYYNCTKSILANLGQMYVADDRFRQNIDRAGGEGTAEFVSRAIEIYCK